MIEETNFKINDFNYLNQNENYYQYNSPSANNNAHIIRSNSE